MRSGMLWTICSLGLILAGCGKQAPAVPVAAQSAAPEKPAEAEEVPPPRQPEPLNDAGDEAIAMSEEGDIPQLTPVEDKPNKITSNSDAVTLTGGPNKSDEEEDDSDPDELAEKEKKYLAELKKDPENVKMLVGLARISSYKARNAALEDRSPYQQYRITAGYLDKALQLDPGIEKSDGFRQLGAEAYYNDACAKSLDDDISGAMASLTRSIKLGFGDLHQIRSDKDLDNLRSDKEFGQLLNEVRQRNVAVAQSYVNQLFQEQPNFKFDFDLIDSRGKPLAKRDFAGKILMVNIWGTWCGPCRAELPDLAEAYSNYRSRGFELVGLNLEDGQGEEANQLIREYQKKYKLNYRCALGNDKIFSQIPDFGAVPVSLFFDHQGRIRAVQTGSMDGILLEAIIQRMLKESDAAGNRQQAGQ